MSEAEKKEWLIQLKWQNAGLHDAAALLARCYGEESEKYVELIRIHAKTSEKLIARITEELK